MSDLISRADAKKAVYLLGKRPQINEIWDCLDALPSAKYITEKPNDAVKASNDVINRSDAIDAVAEEWLSEASAESPYVNDNDIDRYRELAEELFADIPSADAVHGEWHKISPAKIYECSVCHHNVLTDYIDTYNFCPSCGARMKGGAE